MAELGPRHVSRLLLDTTPFTGRGHARYLVCKAMRQYYTEARIAQTLDAAVACGITSVFGGHGLENALKRRIAKAPDACTWVLPIVSKWADPLGVIRSQATCGAHAIVLPGAQADGLIVLRQWIEHARSFKVLVGVGAETPRRLLGYARAPADFFTLPICRTDECLSTDYAEAFDAIATVGKPVIAYRMLPPDAKDPRPALEHAFRRLAAKDLLAVGVFPKDDPEQLGRLCSAVGNMQRGAP